MAVPGSKDSSTTTTSVHVTALDAIVSVNSLFTAIVFLGISFNINAGNNSTYCAAGDATFKRLIVFEVVSFSCFLFSSLLAQGLKLHINLLNCHISDDAVQAIIEKRLLKFGLVASAFGSASGCSFLMFSMVNVIQIRLGTLSCSKYSAPAAAVLIFLVTIAIFVYGFAVYSAMGKPKGTGSSHGQSEGTQPKR